MAAPSAAIASYDRRVRQVEAQAQTAATRRLGEIVAKAGRDMAAAYVTEAGSLTSPVPETGRARLRAVIRRIVVAAATAMLSELPHVMAAVERLARQAAAAGTTRRVELSDQVRKGIAGLRKQVSDDLGQARQLVDTLPLAGYSDVTTVLAKTSAPAHTVAATARWATNQAATDAAYAAAQADGVSRLWIAERDACLTCLAYSGELAKPGRMFPAGRSFGTSSTVGEPVHGPPAHPNCRCRIVPYDGHALGVAFPQALQREAERSVLRGDSAYASRPAQVAAADRLLKHGMDGVPSGLPETVKARARRKVAAGVQAWTPPGRRSR